MLYFRGDNAFTEFRLQKIFQQLKSQLIGVHLPPLKAIIAHYVFLVDVIESNSLDLKKIESLLLDEKQQKSAISTERYALEKNQAYSGNFAELQSAQEDEELDLWVVPRIGTISPWSSKATDIAKICDINSVKRIERGVHYHLTGINKQNLATAQLQQLMQILHDPMTQSVVFDPKSLADIFSEHAPRQLISIDILQQGKQALEKANAEMGLALSPDDINYLYQAFSELKRNPTDTELMMFSQVNSEHCRHKIFNGQYVFAGEEKKFSLFDMIRNTHRLHPDNVLVAYKDNAAVLKGSNAKRFFVDPSSKQYCTQLENSPIVLKVETHNHPTAISPFPGAATGSGGEIRDEAATGRGAKPKAGLAGFCVSDLNIPDFIQPWEKAIDQPKHMASALNIMLEGPIGAASFNNEFGRPNLCGYFRTLLQEINSEEYRGYHKPVMIAGGIGNIRESLLEKHSLPLGTKLIVIGGPAMAIGLGGGAASSMAAGASREALDFASVQRSNPEMQRRCQELIDVCCTMGSDNPILSIHDVGAGGLSNAFPELVHASERGAHFEIRDIPNAAPGMTPMEIWCNEAQERFVLAIKTEKLPEFTAIATRERCPFAVVGEIVADKKLQVHDRHFHNDPVNLPLELLFEKMPRRQNHAQAAEFIDAKINTQKINLAEAIERVLKLPSVANKSFLITIGDRSVGGFVARDQMVGPWQIPVADVAVTCNDYQAYAGEALAMGERPLIALIDAAASARMAVGEALTNIAAATIENITHISLSANWMAEAHQPTELAALYDAVQTIGMELCPALGIAIPVGKDSLSMSARWQVDGKTRKVIAPMTLNITAAAAVTDVRRTLTPELQTDKKETCLLLIDLGKGMHRLGGSALTQCYNLLDHQVPDLDDAQFFKNFFSAMQKLNQENLLLAYHDRSDGGLLATLCEMSFAARVGLNIELAALGVDPISALFAEELGAVIQIRLEDFNKVQIILRKFAMEDFTHRLGNLNDKDQLAIFHREKCIYQQTRAQLQQWWSETSYHLCKLRDNPDCAQQEFDKLSEKNNRGLSASLTFNPSKNPCITIPNINLKVRPKIAILREQGVNGQLEMAAAFDRAGFDCVDVHMSDLIAGYCDLKLFKGMVACGGFSYGDVLGAGRGWAQSILMHAKVRDQFADFFQRNDTFSLGICNGCQMFSYLKALIPGADHWPRFLHNRSEQFEARLVQVEVDQSPSLFFRDMQGSKIPIVIAHGEGRAAFANDHDQKQAEKNNLVTIRYINSDYKVTENYPDNPSGSPVGIAGLTTSDGRATILMPHPERVFRTLQFSWHPDHWDEDSPWMRLFYNARAWV